MRREEAMRNWLFFSIAINLLLTGLAVGMFLRPVFMLPPPPMQALFDRMPEHGRELVRKAFDQIRDIHEESRKDFEAARESLVKAMQADPLDAEALAGASEKFKATNIRMLNKIHEHMDGLAHSLTPEERKIMAEHLRQMPPPPSGGPPGFGMPPGRGLRGNDAPPPPPSQ
jgi:uncharacterized membrane protein